MKTINDALHHLGLTVLILVGLPVLALMGIGAVAIDGITRLHNARWLGPIAAALLLSAVLVSFIGCAAAPRDPRDPDVWRPTTPALYPLPR